MEARDELPQWARTVLFDHSYHVAVMPPKVEYRLSDFGQTLAPVIDTLVSWSRTHETEVRAILGRKELADLG